MAESSNKPPRRELSPLIRAYFQVGDPAYMAHGAEAFALIVGRNQGLCNPVNAALFAILVELQQIASQPEWNFDQLEQLVGDLKYLKEVGSK
ncbi:hypothetical protein [Halomonas getboli]|uniref:hypothetical protein n=1 Tax=Halomonas getboli TaxID=2935862 RepID=UPI0020001376|nr:hypothetical protein [Halomonas getboli]MCK2185717.1 hypothetical protein [Halomonas getboli]